MQTDKIIKFGDEETELQINEFNMDIMKNNNPAIVMIAKRGSGKSWICRDIMNNLGIQSGIVISPTDKLDPFYKNFFPDTFIYHKYENHVIERLLYRQELLAEKNEKNKKENKKMIDDRAFIVMDDCLSSKGTWMRDEAISNLLYNGRHYHLTYILTMQYPLGITPELRCNFDYVFIMAEDNISNLKRIYEHYAGMFPSFDIFKSVFSQLTANYGAMVINNRGSRTNFLDKIFWYKAKNLDNMTMIGTKQFIEFHNQNYNMQWKKKKNIQIDMEYIYTNRKNIKNIKVKKTDDNINVNNNDNHQQL
jgi:hypothetical protein